MTNSVHTFLLIPLKPETGLPITYTHVTRTSTGTRAVARTSVICRKWHGGIPDQTSDIMSAIAFRVSAGVCSHYRTIMLVDHPLFIGNPANTSKAREGGTVTPGGTLAGIPAVPSRRCYKYHLPVTPVDVTVFVSFAVQVTG